MGIQCESIFRHGVSGARHARLPIATSDHSDESLTHSGSPFQVRLVRRVAKGVGPVEENRLDALQSSVGSSRLAGGDVTTGTRSTDLRGGMGIAACGH